MYNVDMDPGDRTAVFDLALEMTAMTAEACWTGTSSQVRVLARVLNSMACTDAGAGQAEMSSPVTS